MIVNTMIGFKNLSGTGTHTNIGIGMRAPTYKHSGGGGGGGVSGGGGSKLLCVFWVLCVDLDPGPGQLFSCTWTP